MISDLYVERRRTMTDTSKSTDQAPKLDSSDPKPGLAPTTKAVFLRRAEGQSFEEFKEVCIKRFKEAGLIK